MEFVKGKQGLETIIKIKSFKDLTPAALNELQAKYGTVRVQLIVPNKLEKEIDLYTPRTYKRLYNKICELTDGIDDKLDDPLKFLFIYRRMTRNVVYDYQSIKVPRKKIKSDPRFKPCRNLVGPLLEGKAVCSGFATTLRAACDFVDVPCLYIDGMSGGGGHSWNQVCLNGKWIGIDATWDAGGRMKNCSNTPEYFNTRHDYDSLLDFARGDNHLLKTQFNWSKYLNRYLRLNTDCEYSEEELEHYYDLLEDHETRGGDIRVLLNEISERIKLHENIKRMFRLAGYNYEKSMKSLKSNDIELCNWIISNGYSIKSFIGKRIIDEFSTMKVEEERLADQRKFDRMKLKEYKALSIERWATRNGIDYDRIRKLRIDQEELYSIIHSSNQLHRIKGVKKIRVKLKISQGEIRKLRAMRRVKHYGGKYNVVYEAGYTDKQILEADENRLVEMIIKSLREYNSQHNIDRAVMMLKIPYERLKAEGITDYVLNEVGRYQCNPHHVKALFSYKYEGKHDPILLDSIVQDLKKDIKRNTPRTRKNAGIDEREER